MCRSRRFLQDDAGPVLQHYSVKAVYGTQKYYLFLMEKVENFICDARFSKEASGQSAQELASNSHNFYYIKFSFKLHSTNSFLSKKNWSVQKYRTIEVGDNAVNNLFPF
jgi:hypothetical protein